MPWPRAAVPLAVLLACAGGGDDDGGDGSGFGVASASASTPTVPTTATLPAGSEGASEGSGDDTLTSGPPPTTQSPTQASGEPTAACGNNIAEDGEACDGDDLNGKDCTSFGFDSGALACTPDCTSFDTALCAIPGCGDGVLMGGEECDCGEQPGACTPEALNTYACTDLTAPNGAKYTAGTLGCHSPAACNFDTSGCTYCGDNATNGREACDGASLGGQTCASLGFKAGTLACQPGACTFNTAGCTNVVCGDGECGPGEDPCACPDDCPDDAPDMCSPCECGATSQNCGCDILCLVFEDCCANGPC